LTVVRFFVSPRDHRLQPPCSALSTADAIQVVLSESFDGLMLTNREVSWVVMNRDQLRWLREQIPAPDAAQP
jgi:hypothetical protein